ncbi:hypothetical protein OB13_05795 [Pontibacter sp. HJ8]
MIKKLLLCLFCFCAFTAAQAQDSLHVKPQVSAPYKAAIGFRYSPGGPMGGDLGVTAKYFFRPQSALEAYSNLNLESRYFLASLSYIWQPKLATSERFRPYAGIGGGVLRNNNIHFVNGEQAYINPVAIATLGMEYQFKKLPLALSLDYRSTFMRFGNSTPDHLHLSRSSNLGLGVKYTFR